MFVEISCGIQRHKRRIEEIAARVQAGTYLPRRRSAEPAAPAAPTSDPAVETAPAAATDAPRKPVRKPPPPSMLPRTFGWLMPLIPTDAIARRGSFDTLLRDPGMVALMEAAPVPLSRPIRALCRMFGLKPPTILPPPRRPRPPKPPRAKKDKPQLPAPYKPPPHPGGAALDAGADAQQAATAKSAKILGQIMRRPKKNGLSEPIPRHVPVVTITNQQSRHSGESQCPGGASISLSIRPGCLPSQE
jgi:hypothetical protein